MQIVQEITNRLALKRGLSKSIFLTILISLPDKKKSIHEAAIKSDKMRIEMQKYKTPVYAKPSLAITCNFLPFQSYWSYSKAC